MAALRRRWTWRTRAPRLAAGSRRWWRWPGCCCAAAGRPRGCSPPRPRPAASTNPAAPSTMGQMSGGSGSMSGSGSGASAKPVDGVTPIPTQTLGTADWQHMKIMAQARTAVPFVVDDGTSEKLVKPSKRTSFHLMVMLTDDRTNYTIPYASVWATIRRGSKIVFDERQWPMISEYMGPHYGNNVTLPGPGTLPAQPARQPAGVGRHIEYAHIWLKPHRGRLHVPLETQLVSRQPEPASGTGATRRRFLAGGTALVVGGGAAAVAGCGSSKPEPSPRSRGRARRNPPACPAGSSPGPRRCSRDADGNPSPPRHDRLLMFDVNGRPGRPRPAARGGLAHARAPVPRGALTGCCSPPGGACRISRGRSGGRRRSRAARALSDFELPAIDAYDLCLHLACDDESRLADDRGRARSRPSPAGRRRPLDVSSALTWRETRTGFTGAGLPAAHQHVGGIPAGAPGGVGGAVVHGLQIQPEDATRPARTRSRSPPGPFAGGTTMAVSYMRLRLDSWYGDLSHA